MADFVYLNKAEFDKKANELFGILYDNMEKICPTGNSREEDFFQWFAAVSEGIKKENRHIILICKNERIIGYFQYYTTDRIFMMEEIQICEEFQGKDNIFRKLYSFVLENISHDIEFAEAYASRQNHKSIAILGRLGLRIIDESERNFHFKGKFSDLMNWHLNQ